MNASHLLRRAKRPLAITAGALAVSLIALPTVQASSHREAPNIAMNPSVDATDLYMFRSYETGRAAYVTILANYIGLEDSYSGPNYNLLDPNANYDINIDNDGDGVANITYRFKFVNIYRNIAIPVGGMNVPVPLSNVAPFAGSTSPNLNVLEAYTVNVFHSPTGVMAKNLSTNKNSFIKPFDKIGCNNKPA